MNGGLVRFSIDARRSVRLQPLRRGWAGVEPGPFDVAKARSVRLYLDEPAGRLQHDTIIARQRNPGAISEIS
ncbi:hypothetical protein ACFJIW_18910 [Tahibacter sp. UC22_41]|uniref:hypothetical protein n=1 Tax=Tahibacter sp. UC22_41 TaxID=3350178 RepID=UPI0036DA4175